MSFTSLFAFYFYKKDNKMRRGCRTYAWGACGILQRQACVTQDYFSGGSPMGKPDYFSGMLP